jgi:uncharacterized membrane protein YjjP (DUF1212 family)
LRKLHRRTGGGSGVLTGYGSAESRIEQTLAKVARTLDNLQINLTVNSNIDGIAVNKAVTKHQVRRLQSFV